MGASRHTYAVVFTADIPDCADCTILVHDASQPSGTASYGNKEQADSYCKMMKDIHSDVDYRVIQLR